MCDIPSDEKRPANNRRLRPRFPIMCTAIQACVYTHSDATTCNLVMRDLSEPLTATISATPTSICLILFSSSTPSHRQLALHRETLSGSSHGGCCQHHHSCRHRSHPDEGGFATWRRAGRLSSAARHGMPPTPRWPSRCLHHYIMCCVALIHAHKPSTSTSAA